MVQVPLFKESQRMQVSNPTGFQSSASARIMGETIADLGSSVAAVGNKLAKVSKQQKDALRRTQMQILKEKLDTAALNTSMAIKEKGGDGSTWSDEFTTNWDSVKTKVINDMQSSGALSQVSAEEIELVQSQVYGGYNKNMRVEGFKQEKETLKQNVSNLVSTFTTNAYVAPERIDEYVEDYATTLGGAMEAMGKDKRYIDQFNRAGKEQLIRQAILGYQDKGKYDEAKKLALANGHLFSAEDQRKLLGDIRDAKTTAAKEALNAADRRERQLEDARKAEQTKQLGILLGEMEEARKSGNPNLVNRVQDKLISLTKEGKIAATAFGGASAQLRGGQKEVYGQTKLNLLNEYYKATTPEQKVLVEQKVFQATAAGTLDEQGGIELLKLLNTSKNTRLLSPKQQAEYAAVENRIKAILPDPDTIQKMMIKMNPNAAAIHVSKVFGIKAVLDQAKAEGLEAREAYGIVLNKFFDDFEKIAPLPDMTPTMLGKFKSLQTLSSPAEQEEVMKEIHRWGVARFIGNKTKERDFQDWFYSARLALEMSNEKRRYNELYKAEQTGAKTISPNSSLNFIDQVLHESYDNSEYPDRLPLILRKSEE